MHWRQASINWSRYSPALARVYPDFDRMLASGEFAHWAEQLYAPLLAALGRGAEEQA